MEVTSIAREIRQFSRRVLGMGVKSRSLTKKWPAPKVKETQRLSHDKDK